MAILKCKMCGGDLNIEEGMTVCECEYCGSKQTVPTADNEKKVTLYERANRLRYNCEFDKAETVYESIVEEFHQEAEAYWGLVLCKYGIEYVDDPATGKKVPTCHRSSFDSVMEDADFEMVMENADTLSRQVYREQAKEIEEIRKGIIEVSGKEQPYDIFICYKESAEDGQRTIDSVLAQDVYEALTAKGYRVFFSRITLEDKLGQEYEPYIFAALNSAKVMLAFGTQYDYYNAVWVKNEWSRFLKLMAVDKSKHLIPCYKNIDAYDIPREFVKLQAQDMGKVGAIQDLVRGIDKIIGKEIEKPQQVMMVNNPLQAEADALYKRGMFALEDRDWSQAFNLFDSAIEKAPEMAEIYVGQALLSKKSNNMEVFEKELLKNANQPKYEEHAVYLISSNELREALSKYYVPNYLNHKQIKDNFSLSDTVNSAQEYFANALKEIRTYFENDRYMSRAIKLSSGKTRKDLEELKDRVISEYESRYEKELEKSEIIIRNKVEDRAALVAASYEKIEELFKNAEQLREKDYVKAVSTLQTTKKVKVIYEACNVFKDLDNYKDSVSYYEQGCELAKKIAAKNKLTKRISIVSAIVVTIALIVLFVAVIPYSKYKKAVNLVNSEQYGEALSIFESIDWFINSKEWIVVVKQCKGTENLKAGNFAEAVEELESIADSAELNGLLEEAKYGFAGQLAEEEKYDEAIEIYTGLGTYADSKKRLNEVKADKAGFLYANGMNDQASDIYREIDYSTYQINLSRSKAEGKKALSDGDIVEAFNIFWKINENALCEKLIEEHRDLYGYFMEIMLAQGVTPDLLEKCYTNIVLMEEGEEKEKAYCIYIAGKFNGSLTKSEINTNYEIWNSVKNEEFKEKALSISPNLKSYMNLLNSSWEATETIKRKQYRYVLTFKDNGEVEYSVGKTVIHGNVICDKGDLAVVFGSSKSSNKLTYVPSNDRLTYNRNDYYRIEE